MEKVAKLKQIARSIATAGAGIGAGISADRLIAKNRRSSRAKKGWETRRSNMTKSAADSKDVLAAVGMLGATSPEKAAVLHLRRQIAKKMKGKSNEDSSGHKG